MNIGQLPPFFIWPYVLFCLLKRRSLYSIFGVLTSEQQNHYTFYNSVKGILEDTVQILLNICENSFGEDGYGELMNFTKNAVFLYFGGIFLVVLKIYILVRHLNYTIFVMIYYLCNLLLNQGRRNAPDVQDRQE